MVEHVVVMTPAYNAAKILETTYNKFAKDFRAVFILVDDHSDDFSLIRSSLPRRVASHALERDVKSHCFILLAHR